MDFHLRPAEIHALIGEAGAGKSTMTEILGGYLTPARMIGNASIWDAIYEHVTYWTAISMETLLRRTGFPPDRLASGYGGQFLQAEAIAGEPQPGYLPGPEVGIAAAAEIARWRRRLGGLTGSAVLWGAGSTGITFANALGDAAEAFAALVDLNPRKQGLNVPGRALQVVGPEALRDLRPELVIVANRCEEILGQARALGPDPEFDVIAD